MRRGSRRATLAALATLALAGCGTTTARINEVWTTEDDAVLTVVVSYCNEDVTLRVKETAESVTLTGNYPRQTSSDDCLGPPLTVTLDGPLGDRDVIDGNDGRRVPLNDPWPN